LSLRSIKTISPFDACKSLERYSNQPWFPALKKEMLNKSFFANEISEACLSADYLIMIRPMKPEWASKVYRFDVHTNMLEEAGLENGYVGLFHVDIFGKRDGDLIPLIRIVGPNRCTSDTYNVRTNLFSSLKAGCADTLALCVGGDTIAPNGRVFHAVFPKYEKLPFLGQIFTADDCGMQRFRQLFRDPDATYKEGSHLTLAPNAPEAVRTLLRSIGFTCDSGTPCTDWTLKKWVRMGDLLKLKPYARYMTGDDCVNCG
jgi:hypothetical protein